MPGKRVARPPGQVRARRIVAAVVAGLVLVGVAWVAVAQRSGDDPEASAARSDTAAASTSPSATSPSARASTGSGTAAADLRPCAKEVAEAESVVAAAGKGVDDWHTHVQARTDMLDGRIPVATMDALWARTRLAGPLDQKRFQAALQGYGATPHCAALAKAGSHSAAASGCLTRSRAATSAVAAARSAMGDWKSHLDHMASYARGDMTSDDAQTMWVSAWKNAPPHIDAYRQARAALADAPACRATAS